MNGAASGRIRLALFVASLAPLAALLLTGGASGQPATPLTGSPVTTVPCAQAAATPIVGSATPIPVTRITAELRAAVEELVACWNGRNWPAYAALLADGARTDRYGGADPAAVAAYLATLDQHGLLPPITVTSAQYGRTVSERMAAIQVAWRQGYALFHDSWLFSRSGEDWLLESISPIEQVLNGPAVGLRLELTDDGIAIPRAEIAQTATTELTIDNQTGGPFAVTLVALPAAADPNTLLAPGGIRFVAGAVFVDSESTAALILEGLPPGDYALITGLDAAILANDPSMLKVTRLRVIPTG